ncbi:CRISPR-associated endoribonuclease Cas6 [Thermosyntropha sp.]|uniref:CRISPR-associated endoribonuclease Cas6 n=1 Tax=Thermosyntropha sp. TaxID=2740820 RepID=UPI0025E5A9BA|nr:CRISPR-associated endoribonuclease Cas6 [Thermosyntropha sp.]MBO8159675.1 CRISPR-associated endoribonuclease Cas6 [Thermosyntropha sp.]
MMLAHLEIHLSPAENGELPYPQMGSLLHGWLMENLDKNYAEKLHQPELKPFSQYLERKKEQAIWHISTLNRESFEHITMPLAENYPEYIEIKHKKQAYKIEQTVLTKSFTSYKELADIYYVEKNPNKKQILTLVTPTAFRSQNEYQIFPFVSLIYQNLINRWNLFADRISLEDPKLIEELSAVSRLTSYKLETRYFSLEKVKIPAFCGTFTLISRGSSPMTSLINMLFAYAEFCGLGIKTSLGMGGIKIRKTSTQKGDEL